MPTAQNRKYNELWRTVDEVGSPLLGKYYKVPAGTSAWTQDDVQLQRIIDFRNDAIAASDDAIKQLGGVPDGRGGLIRPSQMSRPPAPSQPPKLEVARDKSRLEYDPALSARVEQWILEGKNANEIVGLMRYPARPSDREIQDFQIQINNVRRVLARQPGLRNFTHATRLVPNNLFHQIAAGPLATIVVSAAKHTPGLILTNEMQKKVQMLEAANPKSAALGDLLGTGENIYINGGVKSGIQSFLPESGAAVASELVNIVPTAAKAWASADDGDGLLDATTAILTSKVRSKVASRAGDTIRSSYPEVFEKYKWADPLTRQGLPFVVNKAYNGIAAGLGNPPEAPTLPSVQVGAGAYIANPHDPNLQTGPQESGPEGMRQDARVHAGAVNPEALAAPTADQGTTNFYAQLGDLKRNADAMAAGPYPNPGDAARAAQLVDPRPVYPTQHPYGFGARFEPDQVASGRPYAVASQGFAAPADDQGTIVYRTQLPTFHRYGAQPGVGRYGDAGDDPHYGLSYDDGAGGYAQDGSDGFDFLSPASVHAGGWQHPADMWAAQGSEQGPGLLVAAPGARFGYGGAAPAPVIGGIIPLGLGAAPGSDGPGGGSGSVPLYSSYTGYGGAGAVDAQPDVSIVSDPSGWSPRSAVRNILAIAPDDGQAARNWLDPNTPSPQIMLNIPDLSGLIR